MRTDADVGRRALTGAAAVAAFALLGTACAPDGPDAHLAGEPEVEQSTGDSDDASAAEDAVESEEVAAAEDGAVETYPPNGEVLTVLALDNSFIDEIVEVDAGTEVLWTNNGRNDHDVVPVDTDQDWGIEIEEFTPGTEYSHVFTTPGEYPYYCTIHGTETVGMTGTIIVNG